MVINAELASSSGFLLPRQSYLQKFTSFYKSEVKDTVVLWITKQILRISEVLFSVSELLAYLENIKLTFIYYGHVFLLSLWKGAWGASAGEHFKKTFPFRFPSGTKSYRSHITSI